jgi:hypothetical protein
VSISEQHSTVASSRVVESGLAMEFAINRPKLG